VLPELSSSYLDRANVRQGCWPRAWSPFGDIGWAWSGLWARPIDYMHFSADDH
jgi:hypothetical protein